MTARRLPSGQGPYAHPRCQNGAALVIGLLLAMVLAVLATHGLSTSVVDLRTAATTEHRERAFQAAEFGIEQALASAGLLTTYTYSRPLLVPASGGPLELPGSASDSYAYRLYYDTSAGPVPLPDGGPDAGLVAYHFVIESTGRSLRGAEDTHVQGFCVIAPAGLVDLSGHERRRTHWRQNRAD